MRYSQEEISTSGRSSYAFESGFAVVWMSGGRMRSVGAAGAWVFALIVLLACLTTAVGLIASTAAFFSSLTPRIGFRAWAVGFTLAGLLMSNLGLETIIGIAIPLNVFLYPMAVALVFLTLLQAALPFKLTWSYRIPVGVAAVFALLDLARALGFEPSETMPILGDLPLYEQSLSWVIPTAIALVVCLVVDARAGEPAPEPGAAAADRAGTAKASSVHA